MNLVPNLMTAYTNIIPRTVLFSIIFSILAIGMWRRNRSVRLALVTFSILGAFLFTAGVGLEIGITSSEKYLGLIFMSLGIAGIGLSFIKR
jgi:hypothetical protein